MTSDVKNLFSQQLLYHQYFIYLKGYMDDEFGPTAEWDWGEHASKTDGENEWKTDEVCIIWKTTIMYLINHEGQQYLVIHSCK